MKLFEITNWSAPPQPARWNVQFTHPALLFGSIVFDKPQSFISVDDALQYMVTTLKQMVAQKEKDYEEDDEPLEDDYIDYWKAVTVNSLKSAENFGAYHVQQTHNGVEYWFELGIVDGDCLIIYGSPEPSNREEITKAYDKELSFKSPTIN